MQNERHIGGVQEIIQSFRKSHPKAPRIELVQFEGNTRFHGRFMLPLMFVTEYTVIWDDDVMCGPDWLSNCRRASKKFCGALVGGNGRMVEQVSPPLTEKCVECKEASALRPSDLEVDYVRCGAVL